MDDLLDTPVLDIDPARAISLEDQLAQMRSELTAWRKEVAQLRHEILDLRQQTGYWKSMHTAAKERLEAAQHDIEQLQGENRQLKNDLFGRRSEKPSRADRSNDLDDPENKKAIRKRGQQPQRPGPKRRDYSHLPIRETWVDLRESQRRCSCCGQPFTPCGVEDSEQIEIETQVYRCVTHRQRYRRTCTCPGATTQTAPVPAKLIPKSRFGVSVWVEILLDKFATHRPTERLLNFWRMLGFDVAPGTIGDGLCRLQPLFQSIYDTICERNRLSTLFHADETRWRVFAVQDGKTGHVWWLWVFGGADTTVYILDVSRSHNAPDKHLGESEGVLLVDRYSAYKAMSQVKSGQLLLAFCWAHVRRDFIKVGKGWPELKEWALTWLRRIRELYRLNRARLRLPTNPARQTELREAILAMQQQCQKELANSTCREPIRKTLTSLQEHWSGLTLFVEDSRIPMDNNVSERLLRGAALARKNYYGSVALWSGQLAAMMFSILATLQTWNINPRRWLTWFLESCAKGGGQTPTDVAKFLPWNIIPEKLQELRQEPHGPLRPDSG
jgi:transposase